MGAFQNGLFAVGTAAVVYALVEWWDMRFRAKKPEYDEVDGEYVIPIRISQDLAHNLMGGWWPLGFGWAHVRARTDGTYDLFVRQAALSEDLNLIRLDVVQQAMMSSLDLARHVVDNEEDYRDDVVEAAQQVIELVQNAAR